MTNYIEFIQALKTVYPQVISAIGDDAFDVAGNPVAYDKTVVQAYIDANAYKAKRVAEYPPITDYLDGVVKSNQTQIDKYIADCLAVKAKYPKGQA